MKKDKFKRNESWYLKAQNLLLNKKITNVQWQTWDKDDEYSSTGLVFEVEGGTTFFLSSDDEGNSAGALHWQTKKESGVLPTGVASIDEMITYVKENKQ
tara:strand:- start:357 stop:653 length:297 start_codon:yes stop_codon:yes gene_type:complete